MFSLWIALWLVLILASLKGAEVLLRKSGLY